MWRISEPNRPLLAWSTDSGTGTGRCPLHGVPPRDTEDRVPGTSTDAPRRRRLSAFSCRAARRTTTSGGDEMRGMTRRLGIAAAAAALAASTVATAAWGDSATTVQVFPTGLACADFDLEGRGIRRNDQAARHHRS